MSQPVGASIWVSGTSSSLFRWPATVDQGPIRVSRTLGLSPNAISVSIIERPGAAPIGETLTAGTLVDLELSDGLRRVTFRDLTIHERAFVSDPAAGYTFRLTLKDWRHKLRRGQITGEYNVPAAGLVYTQAGLVETEPRPPSFQRTLRQLAHTLFAAMGVSPSKYDTTQLTYQTADEANAAEDPYEPDREIEIGDDLQIYPAVRWEFANPASELERLLDEYNFAITLWEPAAGDLHGKLVVVRLNRYHPAQASGFAPAPGFNFDFTEERETLSERPPNIAVIGGRTEREVTINLIPVGLDVDGTIKPLAELSYALNVGASKPYGEFEKAISTNPIVWRENNNVRIPSWPVRTEGELDFYDPETGADVDGANATQFTMLDRVREKASATVWKWYQLPANWRWLLPILPETARTQSTEIAVFRRGPTVRVRRYGKHDDDNKNVKIERNPPSGQFSSIDEGYTIDFGQGIVRFDEATTLRNSEGNARPAEVKLTFSYASKQPVDPHSEAPTNPANVQAGFELIGKVTEADYYTYPEPSQIQSNWDLIRRPELVAYEVEGQIVNQVDLDRFSAQLIADATAGVQSVLSAPEGNVPYIVNSRVPDGLFRQLTWQVGGDGADTTIVANRENPSLSLSKYTYRERLWMTRAAQRNQPQLAVMPFARAAASLLIGDSVSSGGGGGGGLGPGKGKPTTDPRRIVSHPNAILGENDSGVLIPAHSFVYVANWTRLNFDTGDLLDADVVKIDNPIGHAPEIQANKFRIAVTLEDIPAGGVGMIACNGMVHVRVHPTVGAASMVRPGMSNGEIGFVGYGTGETIFPVITAWPLSNAVENGNLALIRLEPITVPNHIFAIIEEAVPIGARPNVWRYIAVSARINPGGLVPGIPGDAGYTVYQNVYNTIEAANNGSGIEGHGVNVDGPSYPATFNPVPIGPGAGVVLYPTGLGGSVFDDGNTQFDTRIYFFSATNADDGTCVSV